MRKKVMEKDDNEMNVVLNQYNKLHTRTPA